MAVAIGDGEALSNHRHQVGNTVESVEIADVPVTRAGVEVDRKEWPPLGTTSWVGVLIAGLMGGIWGQIDGSGHLAIQPIRFFRVA